MVSTTGQKWAALVVGTYYVDKDATFINARLVRASDGLVMRTGQLVLVNTPIVTRMAEADAPPPVKATASSAPAKPAPTSLYTPASSISSGTLVIKQGR